MSMKLVERGQFFIGSDLVATCSDADLSIDTGDDQGDATDGAEYHLIGNARSSLSLSLIVPADGSGENARINTAVMNHENVTMTGLVGGQFGHADGFFKTLKYKSQSKSGSLTADAEFVGGRWKWGAPV